MTAAPVRNGRRSGTIPSVGWAARYRRNVWRLASRDPAQVRLVVAELETQPRLTVGEHRMLARAREMVEK